MGFSEVVQNPRLILGATGTIVGVACLAKWASSPRWVRVGTVDRLFVFPLKSGKAKEVNTVEFAKLGPKSAMFRDRSFCLVKENNDYGSVKEFPRVALVEIVYEDGHLWLRAPDREDLRIEHEDLEYSKEKEVAVKILDVRVRTIFLGRKYDEYISEFVAGDPNRVKLAYHFSESAQRPVRPKHRKLWPQTMRDSDVPALNYTSSVTILTNASMKDLQHRLDVPITAKWLRSNVMIRTDSGLPFEEDKWIGKMRLGKTAVLSYNKPCNRCPAITVDPETAIQDPNLEPLATLRTYRLLDPTTSELDAQRRKVLGESPLFAVNFSVYQEGWVNIGDEVWVEM
ncbi:hypothetical protein TCAL_08131 [Tigriopus californicus]|uniref:MOSC domain-containing protein n=1 Tax=Tigriopus californicus TaxID=6832 RepID=A0A553PJJ9_TIGCA|nr:mitochondrial amidoxime-reducing component 1-like [Tigriopus californicus]TRY77867.1 hypothetical protein TCAL_08131 [Tigriopus californicus]|eukprot:TCALIF_08131-PA protein Name:"Similar to MARC2 Mitochondrial amidoxime reducing component 2 (Bos taurus)" AED:0.00 eAED:0.00 QI:85/1/1/1/1/1/4/175/340